MRQPVLVVSSDTHVGPRVNQLRPHCPQDLLEDFDAFARGLPEDGLATGGRAVAGNSEEAMRAYERYMLPDYRWSAQAPGHNDVHARLVDMDRDGVACEVVFHGSINGEVMPFADPASVRAGLDLPKVGAGMQMYNRWLADFCSVSPERHVGLCQVPMWDIEASTAEVVWAHDHGLRGVNFPAPNLALGIPPYQDPRWEPFFATCAERNMVLNTHIGGGETSIVAGYTGVPAMAAYMIENPWLGRRAIWLLTFNGTFERHPGLKLVLTELPGTWWGLTVSDMDAAYFNHRAGLIRETLAKKPSEYVASNIFMGASFQSRQEAEMAVDGGFDDRLMWGSDYPHPEGTWMFTENRDDPSLTQLSMANTFHDLSESSIRKMCGENAVGCYDLDAVALSGIAERIGPDLHDLQTEPDLSLVPESYHGSGFRTIGALA
ncbi:MAG: amidohydrolase family protein [Acidimicrobiia bacterium]